MGGVVSRFKSVHQEALTPQTVGFMKVLRAAPVLGHEEPLTEAVLEAGGLPTPALSAPLSASPPGGRAVLVCLSQHSSYRIVVV